MRVEQRVSSLMETAQIIENSGSHWYWISEVLYRTCFWLLSTCPSSYVCCEDPPPSSSSSSSSSSVDPDSSSSSRLLTTLQYAYAHFLFHKSTPTLLITTLLASLGNSQVTIIFVKQ